MTKFKLGLSALMLSGILFVGCDKDDDDIKKGNEPEFPTEFSELTVEKNKEQLEDNGIELVNNLTSLKNTPGIKTSIAFSKHLEGSTKPDNIDGGRVNSNKGIQLMQLLASFGEGKTTASKTLTGLRSSEDEFTSIQAFYTEIVGVYTYNKTSDSWSYTKTGDKIIFKFPSTETGITNNAELVIYGYQGVTITSELGGDSYTGDYPTALKADVTVDGVKRIQYTFSASYNAKGDPSAVSTSIAIDTYKFVYEVSNTTTEAKVDYSLTNNDNVLLAIGARGTGNFSSEATGGDDIGSAVTTSSAYFQILNVKFSGDVKAKALQEALETATTVEAKAAAWNANYKLIVFYVDSKKKIADSEFYVTTRTESIWECDWNENEEYVCEEIEETKEVIDVRLVFADGSKSDLETYVEVGFDQIRKDLETFFDDLEND